MFTFLSDDPSLATTIVVLLFVLSVLSLLGYFLFRSIRKTHLKEKEEKQLRLDGVISRSEIKSLVATFINRTNGESPFSLIYIDLDKLDDFAAAFGQKETKSIIKKVSQIIKASLPSQTYLSRYKGDEFIIFLPSQFNRGEVIDIATEILKSFRQKFIVFDEVEIDLTASIAVAQYPHHGQNFDNLLQSLHLSIHSIKKEGGNNLKVYTPSLASEEDEMNYYYQIKRAISERQFMLYYQPIIDLEEKNVYTYEALLRWEHPELGVLSPNKFINIMEQTGDIHWVGQWGLETVVKKHLELKQLDSEVPYFTINLSAKQLMNPKIAEDFQKILKKHKVDASNFILDVREFLIFEKQQIVFDNLIKLRKQNFKIAIDEFGIDMLSFDLFEKIGIEIFKIGYDFIAEDTYNLNKYMEFFMDYAKKHQKIVVCQGIETLEAEKRVLGFNITKVQGYYYAKPFEEKNVNEFVYKGVDNDFNE